MLHFLIIIAAISIAMNTISLITNPVIPITIATITITIVFVAAFLVFIDADAITPMLEKLHFMCFNISSTFFHVCFAVIKCSHIAITTAI